MCDDDKCEAIADNSCMLYLKVHDEEREPPEEMSVECAAAPQPKVAEKVEPASPELAEEIKRCYSNLDLSFENTQEAFKSKTNSDIIRALLVLRMCGIEPLVKHNQRILSVLRATLGQTLFKKLMKGTFFGHFVAGESREEVEPVVARLKRFGVKSILDYSVESDLSTEQAVQTAKSSKLAAEIAPAVRGFSEFSPSPIRYGFTDLPNGEAEFNK
ncbi:hypothetical protein TELCIR_10343 [Teladorsagia circumcincta]|uniref:Proline dehydrogenase n=1 Tax=Teladorsagia circumcincta TaxID=45464 RepID=A0A2G9UCC9_TELCI|nr:hypothetical protein TELCIR_10343 [Teladorsagia circumcincta]